MKTIVLYRSTTGFTKKYAQWIAEALSADITDAAGAGKSAFAGYDGVIFGGCVHADKILGADLIKKNLDLLKGKKTAVFAVGATEARDDIVRRVRDASFTPDQLKQLAFFYLRGGFDYGRVHGLNKIMLAMMKRILRRRKKEELSPDDAAMLAAYDKPEDHVRKENIAELVAYFKA